MNDLLISSLISRLYAVTDEEEIESILEDMGEVSSAIFLDPLFDCFKRNSKMSFSHSIISAITKIQSSKTKDYLDNILDITIQEKETAISWVLGEMASIDYFPEKATELAILLVHQFAEAGLRKKLWLDEYDLNNALNFLNKGKRIEAVEDVLKRLVLDKSLNRQSKVNALRYFLRIGTKTPSFIFMIENFAEFKNTEMETVLTKELIESKWSGGKVTELKTLLRESGNPLSQELLEQSEKKNKKELEAAEKKTQEQSQTQFSCAALVAEIIDLRQKINFKAQARADMGAIIFPSNEKMIFQAEIAKDKAQLTQRALEFRSIIGNLENSTIQNHGLQENEINALLPGVKPDELKKPINQLFLYANSRKIKVDENVFGLRELNQLLNKIGAHSTEKEEEVIKELEKHKLLADYKGENWQKIHEAILTEYKVFLIALDKSLI